MDAQKNDILYHAASEWKKLTEYSYILTYGYKKKLHTISLTFSLEDFPHLAGFQYLKDLSLPRYKSKKIVDKILSHKISLEQIEKGIKYTNFVKPRLDALTHLHDILKTDFHLFSFMSRMYPFTTTIKADYLISSHLEFISYIFIIQTFPSNKSKYNYQCCSAFTKGNRNYETNQRPLTILKKERLHIPTNTCSILYDKLSIFENNKH